LDEPLVNPTPGPGERRRGGAPGEDERGDNRDRDEGCPAPDDHRLDRGRVADPPPDPVAMLGEGVEADEDEEGEDGEPDEEPELVVRVDREVDDEGDPDRGDAGEGSSVPERRDGDE